ncbi:uncharacterized protein B0I36DRAFT_327817 [Microdochium trichocladiopsis]|uniref:Uncharacterized protein n=1 Tax=Microdochium trichocladiopsis TaxID=1682393 RepID=A0A9P8Y3D4_9PEZI|nr:uncharacterized protein B0I36DRAFT_327817 [Microdochium trichocladiopsis]KAH7027749.1 hypothetical protein B0I36DRAFT_327817 [Microdochium trichocladiopsis]
MGLWRERSRPVLHGRSWSPLGTLSLRPLMQGWLCICNDSRACVLSWSEYLANCNKLVRPNSRVIALALFTQCLARQHCPPTMFVFSHWPRCANRRLVALDMARCLSLADWNNITPRLMGFVDVLSEPWKLAATPPSMLFALGHDSCDHLTSTNLRR